MGSLKMSPELSIVPLSSEPTMASANLMKTSPKITKTILVLAAVFAFLGLLSAVSVIALLIQDFVLGFYGFVPGIIIAVLIVSAGCAGVVGSLKKSPPCIITFITLCIISAILLPFAATGYFIGIGVDNSFCDPEKEESCIFYVNRTSTPDSMNAMYWTSIVCCFLTFVIAIVSSGFACCILCRCCRRRRHTDVVLSGLPKTVAPKDV